MQNKQQKQIETALKVARVAYWEYDVANEVFIFNDNSFAVLRTALEQEGSYTIPAADYLSRFVHPDDVSILTDEIRKAFKSTDSDFTSDHEYRVTWGDGQPGYLNILFKVERDENGRVTRLFGTGQDITQRRQDKEALIKQATETETLLNFTRLASGTIDLETILTEALHQALTVSGFEAGLITMFNPETETLELRTHRLPDEILQSLAENGFDGTLCDLVYRRQESVIVTDFAKDSPLDATGLQSLGFQSYQGIPIVAKGQTTGTLCLFGHNQLALEEANTDLLQAIGQQVGFAIRNATLFEQTQASEDRYRTLFDSAADGIEVLDERGTIIDCNKTHLLAMGYSRNEIIGQHTIQFIAAESAKLFKQLLRQILKTGSAEGELEMMPKDGSIIQVWRKAQAIYDADDQIVNIVVYNRDITERKLAEVALQEREEELQILLEFSPNAIGVVNTRTGLFESTNAGAERLYGLAREDLLKVGPAQMSPELQPDGRPSDEKAMEKIAEALDGGRPVFKWTHINAVGREIPCEISLVGLPGARSHLVRFSAKDITERKQAETTIAKRAAELQTVAEVSTAVASARDATQLLQEVVDRTKSRFDFYHVHIYLLNDAHDTLFLTAGAGEVGRKMVAEGRTISLNQEQSLVAQAARSHQGVTENDARANPAFLPHSLLPETCSEMAVPMIVGDRVIGVLDVQADEVGRFTEQDVAIQTTLATQIAVALENTRSFEQAQVAVANLNQITRRLTREGWQDYQEDLASEALGFVYDAAQLDSVFPMIEVGDDAVLENGSKDEVTQQLAQSITVHGEAIGQLTVVPDTADASNDLEMAEIITAVTEQLSTRIENLRLTDQTQMALAEAKRQSQEMALINRVVTKVAASLDLQKSLQIVARELAHAVDVDQVGIVLLNEDRTQGKVVAEYAGQQETEPALGIDIPVEGNVLVQQVMKTRKPVVITDAQHNPLTAPMHEVMRMRGIHTLNIFPLLVGNEVIGTVGIDILDKERTLDEGEMRLAETLVLQAATAVDNARLFEQTQVALSETEALYVGSERIVLSDTEDDILRALIQSTTLRDLDQANIFVFDEPVIDNLPQDITAVAVWVSEETPRTIEVGTRFPVAQIPFISLLKPEESMIVSDLQQDERVDTQTRRFLEGFGMCSFALFPMVVGNQWLGIVSGQSSQTLLLNEAQKRRINSLVSQAAVVLQTMFLYRQEQARAQREQLLREIAAKMRSSSDIDTIMRTAVTEIGRTLGRRSFIRLSNGQSDSSQDENGAT
ncbi:MAG: GAF domain-containing protein [Chloroflexi bacterium]|nr:GAF domain-containing protein [Chloroflexota bacterium]